MTAPPSADLRVMIRNNSDFMVRAWTAYARVLDDVVAGVMWNVVYVSNVRHLSIESEAGREAVVGKDFDPALLKPVSVHAVATSMNIPYETVRGMLARMTARGWCHRTPSGFVVDVQALSSEPLLGVWREMCANFAEMVDDLKAIGLDFDAVAPTDHAVRDESSGQPSLGVVIRVVTECQMRQLENLKPIFGDFARGVIWSAIVSENLRPALTDPDVARRHAEFPLPDDERIPVSIRAIASRMLMPYETARRQIHLLEGLGAVKTVGRGKVIVPQMVTLNPGLVEYNRYLMANFPRLIAELNRIGFDFGLRRDERTFLAV